MKKVLICLQFLIFTYSLNANSLGKRIERFIESQIGQIEFVLHDKDTTSNQHIDIYWVKAEISKDTRVNVMLTSGMSQTELSIPDSIQAYKRIELMLILPDDWEISPEAFKNENNYWPIRLLKKLARYPYTNNTWFDEGHTIEHVNLKPYAPNNNFVACILTNSTSFPQTEIKLKNDKIKYYLIKPLYKSEMNYKLEHGYDSVKNKIINCDEIIRINRKELTFN